MSLKEKSGSQEKNNKKEISSGEKLEKIRQFYSEPENFGPVVRGFCHFRTIMNDSTLDVDSMNKFSEVIKQGLPCNSCRGNLIEKLEKNPFTNELYLRENGSSKYRNTIHNLANISLKKKLFSYEEMIDQWYEKTV